MNAGQERSEMVRQLRALVAQVENAPDVRSMRVAARRLEAQAKSTLMWTYENDTEL